MDRIAGWHVRRTRPGTRTGLRRGPAVLPWCVALLIPFVGATRAAAEEDGQWPMASKDSAQTRYCGPDQITAKNAKDLKVAWTFSTGVNDLIREGGETTRPVGPGWFHSRHRHADCEWRAASGPFRGHVRCGRGS